MTAAERLSQEAYDYWHANRDTPMSRGEPVPSGYGLQGCQRLRWWRRMRDIECRLSRMLGRKWRVGDPS